jgi:hypothetical protein
MPSHAPHSQCTSLHLAVVSTALDSGQVVSVLELSSPRILLTHRLADPGRCRASVPRANLCGRHHRLEGECFYLICLVDHYLRDTAPTSLQDGKASEELCHRAALPDPQD